MSNQETRPQIESRKLRRNAGLITASIGFLIFLIGAKPQLFGMDISPVIGFVQIAVFTFGLFVLCLGGFFALSSLWRRNSHTVIFDLGVRIMSTGFILAMVGALADLFGIGTRPFPYMPFFGYWQARGVMLGEIIIIVGFLMMIPYKLLLVPNKPKK